MVERNGGRVWPAVRGQALAKETRACRDVREEGCHVTINDDGDVENAGGDGAQVRPVMEVAT